jgi:hypothetical protein
MRLPGASSFIPGEAGAHTDPRHLAPGLTDRSTRRERILRSLSISLEMIQSIRFGRRGEAVIAATNRFGGQTYITVHCLDIPKIVGPLLSCSAMNAEVSLSEPVCHTIISESYLPVVHWQMGTLRPMANQFSF